MKSKIYKIIKVLICLLKYIFFKLYCSIFKKETNDIWLISERGTDARDNGYHFYKYMKKNHKNIKVKYVITNNSSDINKIDINDVVYYGSKEHYILFITSKYLISTHIMGFSPDSSLFWRMDKKGLLKINGKRIFLQHGIIKDYIPALEKNNTNLDLFITGAFPEYNYVLKNYGYSENIIKYTGLARYDKLKNNEKNQILIMPTFRKWLNYVNDFKKTDYFKTWNSFLNNKELIKYIEDNNIIVYFYPHYEIQKKYISYFNSISKNIVIADFNNYDVQNLLIESKILVTDYSSVFFDFAYMKKPVIYYQFDYEKFSEDHYQKGYFDYKDNGFGPVCFDEKKVIKYIIDFPKKYIKRSEIFFKYSDNLNCKRIYDEIIEL